jgi:hypothetical protein
MSLRVISAIAVAGAIVTVADRNAQERPRDAEPRSERGPEDHADRPLLGEVVSLCSPSRRRRHRHLRGRRRRARLRVERA